MQPVLHLRRRLAGVLRCLHSGRQQPDRARLGLWRVAHCQERLTSVPLLPVTRKSEFMGAGAFASMLRRLLSWADAIILACVAKPVPSCRLGTRTISRLLFLVCV